MHTVSLHNDYDTQSDEKGGEEQKGPLRSE